MSNLHRDTDAFDNTSHDYEILDSNKFTRTYESMDMPQDKPPFPVAAQQQSRSPGDIELTQCPAYIPTSRSSTLIDTSFTSPSSVGGGPRTADTPGSVLNVSQYRNTESDDFQDDGVYATVDPNS